MRGYATMDGGAESAAAHHLTEHLPEGTELLLGQYKITRYLNSGGFGITYLAQDSLDRTVVIKECFPGAFCRRNGVQVQARTQAHIAELEAVVGLFLREARSLAKLEHPNIVGVHQVFEFNNTAYMALDFIEGRNLLQLVNSPGRSLTPRQIRSILEKLLSAVGAVHQAGLLHRDISPDNIIVTDDYDPVLIDFGAAREQATKATQALSALRVVKDGYSPQEFYLAGSGQGPFSDLYSLAATFYHVITGEVPPDSQRRLSAHVAGEGDPYVPLRERTSAFGVPFCDALDRAMTVLPKDRIKTAEDWRRAMNAPPKAEAPTSRTSRALPMGVSTPRSGALSAPTRPAAPSKAVPATKRLPNTQTPKHRRAPLLVGAAAVAVIGGGVLLAPQRGDTTATAFAENEAQVERVFAAARPQPVADVPLPAASTGLVPGTQPEPLGNVLDELPVFASNGPITLDWALVPPFELDTEGRVLSTARGVAVDTAPGSRVMAIGDAPFVPGMDLSDTLRSAATSTDGKRAVIPMTTLSDDGAEAAQVQVAAQIVYATRIGRDLVIETTAGPQGWSSRVVTAPPDSTLRPNDEVIALIATGARFESGSALAEIVADAIQADQPTLGIAVRRGGAMWSADLPLPINAN
ncbi:MAG: protein kinase [Pseudomonadota bacterium]